MRLQEVRTLGKINLQMYSFMDGTINDSRENLKLASEMGYDGVELFGPNLEIPAGEGLVDWKALKEVADQHGCQAYIVERENTPGEGSRLDVLKADLEYYRTQI